MDYHDFRRQYEEQHPASVPVEAANISEYPWWLTYAVGAMFVASAFFSGVHTIPIAHDAIDAEKVVEILRAIGGISAFLFVESGILVSAYMLVKKFNIAMLVILFIAVVVAMGANLYSVAHALQSDRMDTFTKGITILFGVVAPLIAGLSGGVFVWLHQSELAANEDNKARHRENCIAWDKEILREYNKAKKAEDAAQKDDFTKFHENVREKDVSSKPRVKLHEVAKQVHENGDSQLSTEEMMEKYQISLGSTTKIRDMLSKSNGHSQDEGRVQ